MDKLKTLQINPSLLLILIFVLGISFGTLLLKLPISTTAAISWLNALFTSTSAMTVTGLSVVDTGTQFTVVGQLIILCLIQLGGLGIMSFAVIIFVALGKKIRLRERLLIQQSLNQSSIGGIIKLVKNLIIFSLAIELIGMFLLSFRWVPEYGWLKGIYVSLFHAVSAFNNAGFSIWSNNLIGYEASPIVNIGISLLIIIGGIGFTVIAELFERKKLHQLSLHTRLMLIGTLIVNVVATLIIFAIEYNNPHTLGSLAPNEKWWAAYFQAISTRTAGFNSIDIGGMDETSLLLMVFLMFIGAGSTSTGGGIKLTTFIVIMLAVYSFLKGREEIVLRRRTIQSVIVFKSLAIATVSLLWIFFAVFLLTITESRPFMTLLFEVVSAYGTVGLSTGITASLGIFSKLIIIVTMWFGKLGPITLMYALTKPDQIKVKYPSEDILTG